MTHPHAPPDSTTSDGGFVRVFLGSFLGLALLVATFTAMVDPLGRFGTGLVPPVVTNDRDQKAALYRARSPRPEVLVLGSSRSKTLAPACLERLTGRPAFNFAVNGAGAEDFLAILRFVRHDPASGVRVIFAGVDPETLQGTGGITRALDGSRLLGPYAPGAGRADRRLAWGADLLGWQAVSAAFRSVSSVRRDQPLPEVALDPDGLQRYPQVEERLGQGTLPTAERVAGAIPGVLARYESFPRLDPDRVTLLRQFVTEAGEAGITVTAFIPPVHPALARAAERTAWRPRTEETVTLLRALEQEGRLRYVETRTLVVDTTQFVDAIHFLAPVASVVAGALVGQPDGCALQ